MGQEWSKGVTSSQEVSKEAIAVIAASVPINLIVRERADIFDKMNVDREDTMHSWQREWVELSGSVAWSKVLIAKIHP